MDPNLQDANGMTTPLHLAARNHASRETVMLILKTEPDVTIQNELGRTALDVAISARISEAVEMIEEYVEYGIEVAYDGVW